MRRETKTFNKRGVVNKKGHKVCKACWDKSRPSKRPARQAPPGNSSTAAMHTEDDGAARIAAFRAHEPEDWGAEAASEAPRPPFRLFTPRQVTAVSPNTGAGSKQHPRADVSCQVLNRHGKPCTAPQIISGAVPDSGAQICLMPSAVARRLFPSAKPRPTDQKCMAANASPLKIIGELDSFVRCKDRSGQGATACATFYVADGIPDTYISLSAMMDLRMVPNDFPTPQC